MSRGRGSGRPRDRIGILAIISPALTLPACGSSRPATTAAERPTATTTTTPATATSGAATIPATGTDGRCATARSTSLAPPSAQWPTPTEYLTYSRAAEAASSALPERGGDRPAASAAREYRHAASQPPGSATNPYAVAGAALDLTAAAKAAAAAGLPACARALTRLALDGSGTLGQPAKPASCGPGNLPALGGCVPKSAL
jgi:hypothetical protein